MSETGEPGGLVDDVSETGEANDETGKVVEIAGELGAMVGGRSATGMDETGMAASKQNEGVATVHISV